MNLNHSADHCAWDCTQPVTLERSGRVAPKRAPVGAAKRRSIRTAQRSPSGGVYLGAEAAWHIPRVELPEGVVPAPRDVIIEDARDDAEATLGAGAAAETRWTVLTVSRNRQGESYACGCVDLVVAHHLHDLVVLETPSHRTLPSGAQAKAWERAGERPLRARVQELSREVAEERGARYGRLRYDVIIERQIDVDVAEARVVWHDGVAERHLDIVRVRNPERIDELPVLECELR